MRRNEAGFLVSHFDAARCSSCGLCRDVCPSVRVNEPRDLLGSLGSCGLCHATDSKTRRGAQSGGATGAIVKFLLETSRIDGAVLTRFNPATGHAEAFLATVADEVDSASGSCYSQSSVVEVALKNRTARLAIVALGCQSRALARLIEKGMFAVRPLIVGLACEMNYSADYISALIARSGIRASAVRTFKFRDKSDGGWPGNVLVSDGLRSVHVPSRERLRLKKVYEAPSCLSCGDKMNVASDLVICDPWGFDNSTRQAWNNIVIARTAAGEEILAHAIAAKVLESSPVPQEAVLKGQGIVGTEKDPVDVKARLDFALAVMKSADKSGIAVLRAERLRALFAFDRWKRDRAFSTRRNLKVLAYGFGLEGNFGGPSLVHGLSAALARLYPASELVVYQPKAVDPVSVSDLSIPVKEFPYRKHPVKFYRDWLLLKLLGRRSRSKACAAFWDDFNAADAVAYIYPICFCSKIKTEVGVSTRRGAMSALFKVFAIGLLARLSGKLSVKTTASFGPMENAGNAFLARLACRFAFTRVVARESECQREMREVAHVAREIPVAPDIANCWHSEDVVRSPDVLGVSVSYQSERQCSRLSVDYVALMRGLIEHASSALGCRILIMPNQFKKSGRDDAEVAREIMDALPPGVDVQCFDARHSSPGALHDAIAGCAAMVTCRYHSCVAAFASGVPQLVLGWHCKYLDLCEWYGAAGCVVSQEDIRLDRLCTKLDEIWKNRAALGEAIVARRPQVESAVLSSVRHVFEEAAVKKEPRVSVVVPVYNVEKYLRRSLDSILAQTLGDIEVVCVDDGSTDGSPAILEEYAAKDPRIRVLRQANAGAGAARNAGLAAAKGEYLFFFDPDDSCDVRMLEVLYARARRKRADVVVMGQKVVDAETGATIKDITLPRRMAWLMHQPFSPLKIADRLFSFAKAVPWDKLFRRAFVEENQLRFMALPRSNDVYFVDMALALAKRIALVRKGYYRYSRRRGGSLTFSKDRHPLATIQAYDAIEAALKEHGLWESFRASFAEVYFQLAVHNLSSFREEANFRTVYGLMRERLLGYAEGQNFEANPRIPRGVVRRGGMLLAEQTPDALWKDLEVVRQRVKEGESAK